ncbi:MAG: purine-binding chemotaxis protein CheW [Balneolaceae bacterium]|nr:purine-binding chemotaxis protein CheW [Balneolaceae bacterium]MCH8548226.1 chemotaxis protein CheW [Balneolaceae bacterium]
MEDTAVKEEVKNTEDQHQIKGGKFLSFFLGKEEYAIEILKVQEIIGLMPITPVPRMPEYIRGVLNLRGKIVPVMNLRSRFGLQMVEDTDETCIIVVQEKQYLMGIVVDKVSEVADIQTEQIEEVPSLGAGRQSDYLSGIGKAKESVKMIMDVEKVLFDVPDNVLENSGSVAAE